MPKKNLIIFTFICTLFFLCSGCNSKIKNENSNTTQQDQVTSELYSYIQNTLDYTITDLRVVAENDGYHIVINVPGTPDMLQKLCEDSVNKINNYATEHGITITKINPVILSSNNTQFGWSTTGTLYSSDKYPIAENVHTYEITSTLSNNIDFYSYTTPTMDDVTQIDDKDIEWEIISTQDYVREGKECIGYRIYINTEKASITQYRNIFQEIITGDDKYLHTVWFYFTKSDANGTNSANVTMEQTIDGIIPFPQN